MALSTDKFQFGTSWAGIIFNPVGYSAQRESVGKAAAKYALAFPPKVVGTTTLQYKEERQNWINQCAAKLKSDDVGKSVANCIGACQAEWDKSPTAKTALAQTYAYEAAREANRRKTITIAVSIALVVLIATTIIFIKTKK